MKILPLLLVLTLILTIGPSVLSAREVFVPTERRVLSPDFTPPASGPIRVALFDADSTLRVAPSGKPSANAPDDVTLLPNMVSSLQRLQQEGYLLAVVSNQAGIEEGYVTIETAQEALAYMLQLLSKQGVWFHYFDFAEGRDDNRKPETGMAKRLGALVNEKFQRDIDWRQSIMVGDSAWKKGKDVEPDGTPGTDFSNSDRLFAENIKKELGPIKFFHPKEFFGWIQLGMKEGFGNFDVLQTFQKRQPKIQP